KSPRLVTKVAGTFPAKVPATFLHGSRDILRNRQQFFGRKARFGTKGAWHFSRKGARHLLRLSASDDTGFLTTEAIKHFMNPWSSMAAWVRVLTAAALTLVCGCAERPAPAAPPRIATNVLIITIDTLRADRVGVYGATNVETPNLDRLAREGAWAPQSDV